jgi:hypothetical protein
MIATSNDGDEDKQRFALKSLATFQQRFEESRAGEVVISSIVILILLVGLLGNLPDSPIKRAGMPVVETLAAGTGLAERWTMFAPDVDPRLNTIQVDVTMRDQSHRIWTVRAEDRVFGVFSTAHWTKLMEYVVRVPDLRPGICDWVVRQVTGPSERAAHVAMSLHTQNLVAPGEETSRATATKILYEADLTGGH